MYFLSRSTDELGFSSFEEEISRRAKNGDTKSYLYIVPTGAAARELINWVTEECTPQAIALPYILSLDDFISRIARFIRPDIHLLSPAESAVFIELALKELLRDNALNYFERSADVTPKLPIQRGTFERLVAGIAGLKEHGITPERLSEDIKNAESDPVRMIADRSALRQAHDVAAIYKTYQQKLGAQFTDTNGQYQLVSEYFELPSETIGGGQKKKIQRVISILFPSITDIFIGSFIRLPEPAREILFALSHLENIRLTFGIDYEKNNPSLFALQERLLHQAVENGFAFITPKQASNISENAPFQKHLRTSFFNSSYKQSILAAPVHLHDAKTMEDEIRFAAKKIKEIITEESIELSRICVASFRQDDYAPMAQEIFHEYGIPANITDRARLDRAPLYLAFNALFDLAEFHLNRRSLLRLLSSPYLLIEGKNGERIDAANLYEVITEFRLHQGSTSWQEEIGVYIEQAEEEKTGIHDEFDAREIDTKLQKLIQAKEDIAIIENLLTRLESEYTPAEFLRAMLKIMSECRIVSQLLSSSKPMMSADALEFDTRSYRAFTGLLEELLDVCSRLGLDKKRLPLSFYTERIRIAALGTRFAPRAEPGRGVIITSFEQTIGYEFDHLFLIGLNDGIFPENYSPSLFNLKEHQPDEDEKLTEQRYLFYQTLCTFKKEAYLICHTSSNDKKSEILRSQFVDSLEEIISVQEIPEEESQIFSANEFFRYSTALPQKALHLAKEYKMEGEPFRVLEKQIPYSVLVQKERNSASTQYAGTLPLTTLTEAEREDLLAFKNRVYSISQLETYAACPFRFFAKYILRLEPGLKTAAEEGLSGAERGTMLHDSLYQILTGLRERGQKIRSISDEDFIKATNEILDAKNTSGSLSKNHPFIRLDKEELYSPSEPGIGVLKKFIDAERKFGKFITSPSFFEATFGLPLAEDKRDKTLYSEEHIEIGGIKFRGKIDRIDMNESGSVYTVTDYKSRTAASKNDIDTGVSLQLPLYLRIAEDLLRAHIGDKEMSGVAAMYHTLLGKESKQQLALGIHEYAGTVFEGHGSGGKNKLKSEVETAEELEEIINATIEFAKSYVEGITRGEFPLVKETNRETACRYCDYKKVCRVGEAVENGALRN